MYLYNIIRHCGLAKLAHTSHKEKHTIRLKEICSRQRNGRYKCSAGSHRALYVSVCECMQIYMHVYASIGEWRVMFVFMWTLMEGQRNISKQKCWPSSNRYEWHTHTSTCSSLQQRWTKKISWEVHTVRLKSSIKPCDANIQAILGNNLKTHTLYSPFQTY